MSPMTVVDGVVLTAGITIAVVAVTIAALALCVRVLRAIDRRGPDGEEDSGDGGRGVPRGPKPPPDDGGGGEPAWWSDFEAEFADYVGRGRPVGL